MGCMNQRVPVFMRSTADGVRVDALCFSELIRVSDITEFPPFAYCSMDIESLDQDELNRSVFKLCDVMIY